MRCSMTAGTAVFSSTAPPPNLTDLAPKIKQPLFVIWAPNGGNIEHMSKEYYELAGSSSKQIWEMPTAKHAAASATSRRSTNAASSASSTATSSRGTSDLHSRWEAAKRPPAPLLFHASPYKGKPCIAGLSHHGGTGSAAGGSAPRPKGRAARWPSSDVGGNDTPTRSAAHGTRRAHARRSRRRQR